MKTPPSIPSWRRFVLAGAVLAAALFAGCTSLRAQDAPAASGPTPYPDPHTDSAWPGTGPIRVFPWMTDNRKYFWTQRDAMQGAVVFVGDSLIGNWDLTAKVHTAKAFPHLKKVANRGIGGDVTRGVLWRLQEDVLDLHPEAVVILIGTNDLSAKAPVDGVASNISAILDKINAADPNTPIILCKLPPRHSSAAVIDDNTVTELNSKFADLAQAHKNVTVFDTYTLFGTPDGKPDPANYAKDLLHPSSDGYAKFADGLTKIFEQLNLK